MIHASQAKAKSVANRNENTERLTRKYVEKLEPIIEDACQHGRESCVIEIPESRDDLETILQTIRGYGYNASAADKEDYYVVSWSHIKIEKEKPFPPMKGQAGYDPYEEKPPVKDQPGYGQVS
jgi:hypothetical protein